MNNPTFPPSKFAYSLCNCNCKICCLAHCCPCITFGINKSLLNGTTTGCLNFSADCCFCFLAYNCSPLAYPCLLTGNRLDIRTIYNIEGSCCGDFCCTLFCPFLTLIQDNLELEMRKKEEELLSRAI
jgi:Cys-rich protein (TIGR01571 family)